MDLKEFVAESLKEIVLGVQEAQRSVQDTNAVIAPKMKMKGDSKDKFMATEFNDGYYIVTFDVAVTAQESAGQKGKAGLSIPYFSMGGGLEASQENGTISRLKFELPIVWPTPSKK